MMKSEFEALLGHAVTPEEFDAANAMYMESPLNKEGFVKEYKKCHLAESEVVNGLLQKLNRAKESIRTLTANIGNITEALEIKNQEIAEFLIAEDALHSSDSLRSKARAMLGDKAYIKTKIKMMYPLNSEDIELIDELLK